MKTFKTVLLITGILVAGMAFNTMAQTPEHDEIIASARTEKVSKHEYKHELKAHKHELKQQKHEMKNELKHELKRHKHVIKSNAKSRKKY